MYWNYAENVWMSPYVSHKVEGTSPVSTARTTTELSLSGNHQAESIADNICREGRKPGLILDKDDLCSRRVNISLQQGLAVFKCEGMMNSSIEA